MMSVEVESKPIGLCFVTVIVKSGNGYQGRIDKKDCEFYNLEVGDDLKVDFLNYKQSGRLFDLGFSYPIRITKQGKKSLYFRIPKEIIDLYGFEAGDRLKVRVSAHLVKKMK